MVKTGNVLAGFLLGAFAGVITGILVAPHSGAKTRELIKKKVSNAAGSVTDEFNEQIDQLEEKTKRYQKASGRKS